MVAQSLHKVLYNNFYTTVYISLGSHSFNEICIINTVVCLLTYIDHQAALMT